MVMLLHSTFGVASPIITQYCFEDSLFILSLETVHENISFTYLNECY